MNAKLFKNKIKAVAALFAIVLGVSAAIAMKAPVKAHKAQTTSTFYVYTSSSLLQADIQNINNYEAASDACSGSSDVCGVTLTTAQSLGSTPVTSEFNTEKSNLWLSQENNTAEDGNISMKN